MIRRHAARILVLVAAWWLGQSAWAQDLSNAEEIDAFLDRAVAEKRTIRQLLSHSSGLVYAFASDELARWSAANPRVDPINAFPLLFDPGEIEGMALDTEFWIDPVSGIGAVLLMQHLPFYDDEAIATLVGFEELVYRGLR